MWHVIAAQCEPGYEAKCDEKIKVTKCSCAAYEVTKVDLDQNPSYEEMKSLWPCIYNAFEINLLLVQHLNKV